MIAKARHHIRPYRYLRSHRMLPSIPGASGAGEQDLLVADLPEGIDFTKFPTRAIPVEDICCSPDIRAYLEHERCCHAGIFGVDEICLHGGECLRQALWIETKTYTMRFP
ncbi:hypothetical protein HZ994_02995 [Akkermansiaceae bacterium]|nr:hypothetical protein HZ994_02995 [Akkermansiaceae bacterium]